MGEQQSEQWNFTAEELIARAERRARADRTISRICIAAAAFLLVSTIALSRPVHTWLHAHLQFLAGVLLGSILEGIVASWVWWRVRKTPFDDVDRAKNKSAYDGLQRVGR